MVLMIRRARRSKPAAAKKKTEGREREGGTCECVFECMSSCVCVCVSAFERVLYVCVSLFIRVCVHHHLRLSASNPRPPHGCRSFHGNHILPELQQPGRLFEQDDWKPTPATQQPVSSQRAAQSSEQPANQPSSLRITQPASHLITRPAIQPVLQSANQASNQSSIHPTSHLVFQPSIHPSVQTVLMGAGAQVRGQR